MKKEQKILSWIFARFCRLAENNFVNDSQAYSEDEILNCILPKEKILRSKRNFLRKPDNCEKGESSY